MTVETLVWGYGLIEGPRPDLSGGLFFSDVLKGGVYRLAPDGSTDVIVPRRRGVGGIALHANGGLVISGRNVCHVRDGQTRILFERADIGGFNDLFADTAGRIYTGSMRDDPFRVDGERRAGEAYRINAEGDAEELYSGVGLTNGFGLSPDGRSLYHVDSAAAAILVHPIDANGDVDGERGDVFARVSPGVPDGLVVDEDGGVWVAVYGGGCVTRFTATGELDRRLGVPAQAVTSLCFAGPDRRDLIVVTADNTENPERGGTIFRIPADEVGATGLAAPLARV